MIAFITVNPSEEGGRGQPGMQDTRTDRRAGERDVRTLEGGGTGLDKGRTDRRTNGLTYITGTSASSEYPRATWVTQSPEETQVAVLNAADFGFGG